MKKSIFMVFVLGGLVVLSSVCSIPAGATGDPANLADLMESTVMPALLDENCDGAKNTCADYSIYWQGSCPAGERCITFKNSCTQDLTLSYNIGCNGDGTAGAPQCNCTEGPTLTKSGGVAYWQIVNGDYDSCLPSWQPACLTASLTVMANEGSGADCTQGTRVEFTAGNSADPYGQFDSYNISTQGEAGGSWYSVPVAFEPDPGVTDPYDPSKLNCRPLYCNSLTCPDAYLTPTTGGCSDNRSPQGNCAPTFSQASGWLVEFCPSNCTADSCPSCQKDGSSMNLATGALDGVPGSVASIPAQENESSSSADI